MDDSGPSSRKIRPEEPSGRRLVISGSTLQGVFERRRASLLRRVEPVPEGATGRPGGDEPQDGFLHDEVGIDRFEGAEELFQDLRAAHILALDMNDPVLEKYRRLPVVGPAPLEEEAGIRRDALQDLIDIAVEIPRIAERLELPPGSGTAQRVDGSLFRLGV